MTLISLFIHNFLHDLTVKIYNNLIHHFMLFDFHIKNNHYEPL